MAGAKFASAIQFVGNFLRESPLRTDGQLVDLFVGRRDEAAFAALVQRHGPMVLGVCRQVLRDASAAEDALQATFLVLARRAGAIRRGQAVASWLYQVAYRLALRARAQEAQRRELERQTATMRPLISMPGADQDLGPLLHEEVRRLPKKYQAPIVLCYFEGKTARRAAAQLGWRESVVRGRLFQARALLRGRLTRRGIVLSAGCVAAALAEQTATVAPALAEQTVRAALAFGAGAAAPGVSAPALALAESMAATLTRGRLGLVAFLCLLAGSVGLGFAMPVLHAPAQAVLGRGELGTAAGRGPMEDADLIRLHVLRDYSVRVPGRAEPLADRAQLAAYLKERFAEAARQRGGDVRAVVRVTAQGNANYAPVHAALDLARKTGFTRFELGPSRRPVDLQVKEGAVRVLAMSARDDENDGDLSALMVTHGEDEAAVPTPEALSGYLNGARANATRPDDLNVEVDRLLTFKHVNAVLQACGRAGAARVHLAIVAEPNAAADPEFPDRAVVGTGNTPRPEGTGEEAKAAAVAAGLLWLADHQAADGGWSLDRFHRDGKCRCTGAGGNHAVAGAALGVLPFLRAGQTHQRGEHAKLVEKGLKFLTTRQQPDGSLAKNNLYEHGLATLALCEAYGRSNDPALKEPAQRAVKFLVAAQHDDGGWRYQPRTPGDLSVTGWQVQALRWARLGGLEVPDGVWTKANRFLDSVGTPDGSGYGYTNPMPAPSMTACGLLCRNLLRDDFLLPDPTQDTGFSRGSAYLAKLPPSENFRNSYYYYYATQFMNQEVATGTADWNKGMRRVLLAAQDWGGDAAHQHHKGSWSAEGDAWGGQIGRLGMTSFALLTLLAPDRGPARRVEPANDLAAEDVARFWTDLTGVNGTTRTSQAARALAAAKQAVPFLKQQLRPVPVADAKVTARWIAGLDSAEFAVRDRATQELEKLGDSAIPLLQQALDAKPSLEVSHRLEDLLAACERRSLTPGETQCLQAIRVLEHIGNGDARAVLETVAGGAAGARPTRAARAALERLATPTSALDRDRPSP